VAVCDINSSWSCLVILKTANWFCCSLPRVEEVNWSTWNTNLGIINEDPGYSGDLKRNPSYSIKRGRGEGFRNLNCSMGYMLVIEAASIVRG